MAKNRASLAHRIYFFAHPEIYKAHKQKYVPCKFVHVPCGCRNMRRFFCEPKLFGKTPEYLLFIRETQPKL